MNSSIVGLREAAQETSRSSEETTDMEVRRREDMAYIRRGALWGALAGFFVGLAPLMMSTILAAMTGALIARASHLRIQTASPVRIHSVRERERREQ